MDSFRRVKEIKKLTEIPEDLFNLPEINYEKTINDIVTALDEEGRCTLGFFGTQGSGKSESAMAVAASVRSRLDVDATLGRIYDKNGNPTFREYLSITPKDVFSTILKSSIVKQHTDRGAGIADDKSLSINEIGMNRPDNTWARMKEDAKEYRKRQDKEKTRFIYCEACDKEANEQLTASMLQVHHRDGNERNNDVRNLLILCANHHQMVENWKKKELDDPQSLKYYHGNREALFEDVTDRFLLSMRLHNDGQIPFDEEDARIPEWSKAWMNGLLKRYDMSKIWRMTDHAHFSNKSNAIVFHPYRVDCRLTALLQFYADDTNMDIHISGQSEWYPSRTFKIEVLQRRNKDSKTGPKEKNRK